MADFPAHKGIPLDGKVGSLSQLDKTVGPAPTGSSQIQVFVSGDAASDTRALGLQEDLRLLVQGFVHRSRSSDRKTAADTSASSEDGDILWNTVTAYLLQQIQLLAQRDCHGLAPRSATGNRSAKPTLQTGYEVRRSQRAPDAFRLSQ